MCVVDWFRVTLASGSHSIIAQQQQQHLYQQPPPQQQQQPQQQARYGNGPDRQTPVTPPIVVVSPDSNSENQPAMARNQHAGSGLASPDRLSTDPPKAGTRTLRANGPKDMLPKPPRKQRSSRFHVSDRVDIERLPAFSGASCTLRCLLGTH